MRSRSAVTVGIILLLAAILSREPAAFQASPPDVKIQSAAAPVEPDRTHTGSLVGNVVDASGKPVVGATASLKDEETQESSSTKSGEKGAYEFTALYPGDYAVQAEKDGLRSDSTRVEVHNGKVSRQDLVMNVDVNAKK